jgi:hypothetical protein
MIRTGSSGPGDEDAAETVRTLAGRGSTFSVSGLIEWNDID